MKDKTRRIIAWIGLVFAVIFAIATILSFFDPEMFGGRIGYIAIAAFIVAIVPFCLIYFDNKARAEKEEEARLEREKEERRKQKRKNGIQPPKDAGEELCEQCGDNTPSDDEKETRD